MKRLLALLVLPLAACSSGATAHVADLPPLLLVSPSPTHTAMTDTQLKASAEQFVRDYYAALNRAMSSLDSTELVHYSISRCPCRRIVRVIERLHDDHRTVDKTEFHLVRVNASLALHGREALVEVVYDLDKEVVRNSEGAIVQVISAEHKTISAVTLARSSSSWIVSNTSGIRE